MMRGNSFASITDYDSIPVAVSERDNNLAAVAIEFDRIVNQVRQHLHQPVWIANTSLCEDTILHSMFLAVATAE
jgi:hypothetical protein